MNLNETLTKTHYLQHRTITVLPRIAAMCSAFSQPLPFARHWKRSSFEGLKADPTVAASSMSPPVLSEVLPDIWGLASAVLLSGSLYPGLDLELGGIRVSMVDIGVSSTSVSSRQKSSSNTEKSNWYLAKSPKSANGYCPGEFRLRCGKSVEESAVSKLIVTFPRGGRTFSA